jgi:hypothetical protein
LSEAVPGKGGTASGTILSTIKPIEDYIFQISASLKNINYYEVQDIQNALDTMYMAIGSLKEMAKTYYPATETTVTETPMTQETETQETEIQETEIQETEILEAEQILEQKEDEAKDIIDTTINSNIPNEDKKREIDNVLNEVGYAAVYSTLKKLKSYGQLHANAKELCFKEVLNSFLEIVNESALRKYLNQETLEEDARYVSDYFYDLLANTLVEWE